MALANRTISARNALAQQATFIDLRAPKEFAQGTPPGTVNLPILTDAERHRIGITYKQQGNAAAVKLGHKLVCGEHKAARIRGWANLLLQQPNRYLYCWRGGMRSQIASQWLADQGIANTRVEGGLKALRHAALDILNEAATQSRWVVLGGRTGSGKTQLLQKVPRAIDLEGAAEHRGSAFGSTTQPQPTPVTFEFRLAASAVAQQQQQSTTEPTLVVEDESRAIGRLGLPTAWFQAMQQAPIALLETPIEQRVQNIKQEYVTLPLAQGRNATELHQHFADALDRIKRRLGGERWQNIRGALETSFRDDSHDTWIRLLLTQYYDPMYDYQLSKKQDRVAVQGDWNTVLEFLNRKA